MTPDGKRVLLKDDQTWEYIESQPSEQGEAKQQAPLSLVNRRDGPNSCVFGVKLINTLGYEIKSLIPQFSAMTSDGTTYETIYRGFESVKPTKHQYQEVKFEGIRCSAIARIRVSGADRCTMGELDRFSSAEGECLSYVRVEESDILPFSK